MFSNFEDDSKFCNSEDGLVPYEPTGRKDRSIKYLRAKSAKRTTASVHTEPVNIVTAAPVDNYLAIDIPKTPTETVVPCNSRWSTIRENISKLVLENREEAADPEAQNNQLGSYTKSFKDVVKAAMSFRNWVTSMEPDEMESEPDRVTTTNYVDETENDEKAMLGEDIPQFAVRPSGGTILKEYLVDRFKRIIYFYVQTNSTFYYYWTSIIALGVLYNMLAMVIFIFDDVPTKYFGTWFTLNIVFDVFFLFDILIQSRLAFMHDGQVVRNTRKQLKNYIATYRFVPDLICLLPFDGFLYFNRSLSLVRVIKIFKSYRLMDFISYAQKRTDYPHAAKIILLCTSCYILFHWNACIYFLFSLFEGLSEDDTNAFGFSYYKVFDPRFPTCDAFFDKDCWYDEREAQVLDLDDERPKYVEDMYLYWEDKYIKYEMGNFSREYSMTLYWSSLTITTCGQQPWPSTSPQNMLEVIDTMIGVLVFATIIGSVGNVVTQMNESVNDFREMMDGIKFYMKYRAVRTEIQERVLTCLMYLNSHNQLYDEKEILEVLPPRFQANIAANLHLETLKRATLFASCDTRFLHEVVLLVKQQVYAPNDYICRKDEIAKEMYIIKKGTLSVIDNDNKDRELTQLKEGETFGELSIVQIKGSGMSERRRVSLRSIGYSDIYILHQDDVTRLLQEYPEDRQILLNNARALLNQNTLLKTTALGEKYGDNVNTNKWDDETTIELLSVDEKLVRLNNIVNDIDIELTSMIHSFRTSTLFYKQRVTALEDTYNFNRKRIRRDCIRGVLR